MLGKSPGWEGRAPQGGEVPSLGAEGLLLSSVAETPRSEGSATGLCLRDTMMSLMAFQP